MTRNNRYEGPRFYGQPGFDIRGVRPPRRDKNLAPWIYGGIALGLVVGTGLDIYLASGHKLDSGLPEVLIFVGLPVIGGVIGGVAGAVAKK